jgi:hypothetical protein
MRSAGRSSAAVQLVQHVLEYRGSRKRSNRSGMGCSRRGECLYRLSSQSQTRNPWFGRIKVTLYSLNWIQLGIEPWCRDEFGPADVSFFPNPASCALQILQCSANLRGSGTVRAHEPIERKCTYPLALRRSLQSERARSGPLIPSRQGTIRRETLECSPYDTTCAASNKRRATGSKRNEIFNVTEIAPAGRLRLLRKNFRQKKPQRYRSFVFSLRIRASNSL